MHATYHFTDLPIIRFGRHISPRSLVETRFQHSLEGKLDSRLSFRFLRALVDRSFPRFTIVDSIEPSECLNHPPMISTPYCFFSFVTRKKREKKNKPTTKREYRYMFVYIKRERERKYVTQKKRDREKRIRNDLDAY